MLVLKYAVILVITFQYATDNKMSLTQTEEGVTIDEETM